MKNQIIDKIVDFYLNSHDFNGIPVNDLFKDVNITNLTQLKEFISKDLISINWGYPHVNIHIQAYPPLEIGKQITWLDQLKIDELKSKKPPILKIKNNIINSLLEKNFCIYPTKKVLQKRIDKKKYKNKPYSIKLALGEPQLKPYYFDLSVLDDYMNDPRYHFTSDGLSGSIYIKQDNAVPKRDMLFVEHFGYGIKLDKKNYERCIAVFLCDLVPLSANQQQRWMTKMIRSKKFFLHPEYDRMSRGIWALRLSVFQAFREELPIINDMFFKAFGKKLFKKDKFTDQELAQFHFIIRPTRKLYYEFIHLLDKLISENIDKSFFETNFIIKVKKENNNVEPGTLLLLEKWIDSKIHFTDPSPKNEMINTFKLIRKERQNPGHSIDIDEWNKKYWNMQRKLVTDVYGAIRTLRLIITNNPMARTVKVPEWLYKGEICTY